MVLKKNIYRKNSCGLHSILTSTQNRSFQNPMYTGITQTRQSSNGDKHMTEVPTYATVSKPSKRQTDGNKHNQGMLIHESCLKLVNHHIIILLIDPHSEHQN